MFVKHRIKLHPGEDAVRLVAEYIDYIDPIRTGVDERITFVKKPKLPSNCVCNNSKPYTCGGMSSSAPPSLLMLVMILAMSFLVFLYV